MNTLSTTHNTSRFRWHTLTAQVPMGIALASLLVLVGLPLLFVLLQVIFPELTRGSLANAFSPLLHNLADPELLALTGNSVRLGIAVVIVSALIAVPLGVLRALTRLPGAAWWDVLLLVPFMIPPYIAALAWVMTLQTNGFSQQLLGVAGDGLVFSFSGIVLVMAFNIFPVIYFAVSRTLSAVGGRYAAVAQVCGATPWTAFWRITLPLSLPGLAAGLLLAFALSIEEFGTPATLGPAIGFEVLVTGIHRRFSDWPLDMPGAAVLSLVLVLLALLAFWLQHWLLNRRSYVSLTGKPAPFEKADLGPWRWPVLALFALMVFLAVGVPLLAVLATASTDTLSGGLQWSNLSTRHFTALFANQDGALAALATSLSLATGTALLTGILGALIAYLVVRSSIKGKSWLDFLSLLPNTLPAIVIAVGLILAWNQPFWPVNVYNTSLMLLLAYSCLLLPYPVRYTGASLRQLGDNLEAAARVCGAGFTQSFIRIVLPLIAPSLLVAMLMVFAIASRELVASLMVTPAGAQTVSTFVFGQFEQGSPGVGMAMSLVAILTTTVLLVGLTGVGRRRLPGVG
ncbi:ABC transporter permease [Cellvibrio japonicus]|nr:iron ABC transporter permease [Cellvibrio japonicus]